MKVDVITERRGFDALSGEWNALLQASAVESIFLTWEYVHENYSDVSQFLQMVQPLAVFVGMRMHATALATCAFVPSIMVEYRPKCRDNMKSIAQESFVVRADEFVASEVWGRVCKIAENRESYSTDLRRKVLQMQEYQRREAKRLAAQVQPPHGRFVAVHPYSPEAL